MPAAELIAIGTELLLGEIQDTNTRYLARTLRDLGVNIYRATIIGDNTERIAQVIRESMERCQIIITTGGLGPTVDDPTRAAVALALDVQTEFRPELWEQIQARFQRYGRIPSENNRRQAWIPEGAIPVENPVGTAPSFICETINSCIISLPGVPREMEYLTQNAVIPYLRERFQLTGTIKAKVLHVAGVGESTIDDWIGDLMIESNPTVGLLAHPGQVDIRITAKAESFVEADQMIAEMEKKVRERVGEGLYGVDQETLEDTVLLALRDRGWKAALVESGLNGALSSRMERVRFPAENILILEKPISAEELRQQVNQMRNKCSVEAGLGISLHPAGEKTILYLYISSPLGEEESTRTFGGERALSNPWSVNTGLELLRRQILGLK
ncbi:MAG: CinA family nicotinamide mononucleotide deamidase-related protein [Anaerolineaceae bacterium]|nr:CinA family nicotinamide mononucleotide deamidase-related protein [Anaerolineaceae bacterium]